MAKRPFHTGVSEVVDHTYITLSLLVHLLMYPLCSFAYDKLALPDVVASVNVIMEFEKIAMSVRKLSRVDNAYDHLKSEILNNRMPPGFMATEPEVALRLGMSRTPIREALITLQSEGLVELVPRRGVRVLPISPNDMREIYELLTLLEPEAAASVAEQSDNASTIEVLEKSTVEMEQALNDEDLDRWARADDAFHRELLRSKGNQRMSTFVGNLLDQAHRARVVTLRLRAVPWQSTDEHRETMNAISHGNAAEARLLFRRHREQAASELLDILSKTGLSNL